MFQYHLWDTANTELASDEYYSPTVPGEYTWPLEEATGYYGTFFSGPLPPLQCPSNVPSGTELVGCFTDSSLTPLISPDTLVLSEVGPGGMTAQVNKYFTDGGGTV